MLGQRPGQRLVDDAGELGPGERILRRGLDPPARGARDDARGIKRKPPGGVQHAGPTLVGARGHFAAFCLHEGVPGPYA